MAFIWNFETRSDRAEWHRDQKASVGDDCYSMLPYSEHRLRSVTNQTHASRRQKRND